MPIVSPRAILLAAVAALTAFALRAEDPEEVRPSFYRDGFETEKTSWKKEESDATVEVKAHERSARASREGETSERFAFVAGAGSVLYYSHALPKVPVDDRVRITLHARSNRPGVQVFGRVVLPADVDPDTNQPSFLLVAGSASTVSDRWQKLELAGIPAALEREARILRVGTRRKVSLEGAYLERVVVNLYGGAGEGEVYLDDLAVGPIAAADPEKLAAREEQPPLPEAPAAGAKPQSGRVRLVDDNTLTKDGFDWVPTIIDAPGADPVVLREHGFDVMVVDRDGDPEVARAAARSGLMLMVRLAAGSNNDPEAVARSAGSYPFKEHVAFWDLGDRLGIANGLEARKAELERIRSIVSALHDLPADVPKLTSGTLQGMVREYAQVNGRNLDLLGFEATDWATVRDPVETIEFLLQRKRLVVKNNPRAPMFARIDAAAPPDLARDVWGTDPPPAWGSPQVQPDQIRMYAYAALASGCRALVFRGDADLTTERGKGRLMMMALLNAEIDLVESVIARGPDTTRFWPCFTPDPEVPLVYSAIGVTGQTMQQNKKTSTILKEVDAHPSIKAASIAAGFGRSRLLLVADYAANAQYQPPQMGVNNLKVRIQAPESVQGFEISPAGVQVLKRERTTGGINFILPVFSGSALILVTTDLAMKQRLEAEVAKIAPISANFAIRIAEADLAEATEVNATLARDGHFVRDSHGKPDDETLLRQAGELIASAGEARDRMDYALAWSEAGRVGRSLRVLKKMHFDVLNRTFVRQVQDWSKRQPNPRPLSMTYPISLPPMAAWQTLPQAFFWLDWVREGPFGRNLLPSGSFDLKKGRTLADEGWADVGYQTDGVEARVNIIDQGGYGPDNDSLRLYVGPKDTANGNAIDALVPFLDHPPAALRSPPIRIKAGNIVRIRLLLNMPRRLVSGTGGVIVRDSIAGEARQYRMTTASGWREVFLYRRAPADGEFTVTLGLAGFGEAFFDDLRVDTIVAEGSGPETPPDDEDLARRTPPVPAQDPQRRRR